MLPRLRQLVCTGALVAAAVAPLAAQKIGSDAPDIVWTKTYGFGDIANQQLSDLRGSVVLLEFISTRQQATTPDVTRLTGLHAEKCELGLVVVTVTNENADAVEKWIKKHDVKRPVAIGTQREYRVDGVPDAFLIDKDGKLLWHGHPQAIDRAQLDAALVGAKPAIVLPGLEPVQTMRRSKDYGAAYRTARQLLDGGKLSAAATAQANDWMQQYEQYVQAALAAADVAESEQDTYRLFEALQPVADYYQGVPGADAAKQRFTALMADGKHKREIDAGRKLAQARLKEAAFDFDGAYAGFKEIAQQFAPTKAGKEAAAAMKAYEKDGKLGYDHNCGYCKAGGAACPTHRKKKK